MRRACAECLRVGLQCESYNINNAPCSNCVERGCGTLCSDGQAPTVLQPVTDTPKRSITTTSILSSALRLGSQLREHFLHQLYNVLHILQYVYIPILLFWPLYYADQASSLLKLGNENESGEGSTSVPGTSVTTFQNAGQPGHLDNIELQAIVHDPSPTATQTADIVANLPPYSSTPQLPLPAPGRNIEDVWVDYLDSRIVEWRISTTTAGVFIAASPTIFQIPEASDDPITRSIAFLALCRALAAIIYGPIYLIYFKKNQARTARYASAWCISAQKPGILLQWSPWIMLSLPTVSTCWAFIFYLVAIFSFIWRTGSTADPSPSSPNNSGHHPMTFPLALAIRVAITAITVLDFGCVVWIWRTLRDHSLTANKQTEAA